MGVVRSPSTRDLAFSNPMAALASIATDFESVVRGLVTADLSRIRQIALILDKVPAWMPHDWGSSFLLFMNPVIRLIGLNQYELEGIGPRLFRLAHPGLGPLPTGYLPSMFGEMLVNFPWPIACLFFIPFGIALRWAYDRLIIRRGDFIAVAIYSVILMQSANIILQSLSHVIFQVMVVLLPLLLVQRLTKNRRPAALHPSPVRL
jgi:hypothetical protein